MATILTAVPTDQAAATTIAMNLPAGIVNGTLLVAVITQDVAGGSIPTPPTGWSVQSTDSITNGDHQTYMLMTRVSDGTDGATVTVTPAAAGHNMGAVCIGVNGADTTTGSFGPGQRDFNKANLNSVSPPASPVTLAGGSITPAAGDILLLLGGIDTTGSNGVYSAAPAGYGAFVQTLSTDQFESAFAVAATASGGSATGTQNVTWTQSGSGGNGVIYAMAIKSAAAPPQVPYMNYAAQPMVAQ